MWLNQCYNWFHVVPQCCTVNQSINNFHDTWFLLMLHTGTFKPQYYYVAPPRYGNGVVPHNNTSQLWELEAGIAVQGHHQGVFQCYTVSISKKWMVQTCLKQKYLIYRCDRILFCKSHVEVDGECTCILSTHFDMRCIYVHLIKRSGPNFFAGPTIQTVHPWFYLVCASHEAYLLWWLLALFQLYMVAGSLLNLTLIAISKTCINYW